MKLIHVCLIALIIAHTYPTQSLSLSSYTSGIVCASGALLSAAGTFWANKKVTALETLSNLEKNNPNIRKKLRRWKTVRRVCGLAGTTLAVISLKSLGHAYQIHCARKKIEKQNEIATQKQKEHIAKERDRDSQLIKQQEIEIKKQTGPSLIAAAKKGNLDEFKKLVNSYPDKEMKNELLNARDGFGKTAGYYAKQSGNRALMAYILEQAAQQADNACSICFEEINEPRRYAVGSSNCIDFFCVNCLNRAHEGHAYTAEFYDWTTRLNYGNDSRIYSSQKCPKCNQS